MRRVSPLLRWLVGCVLVLALLLSPRAEAQTSVLIDPLLQRQITGAAASTRLSAIVTFSQTPTTADLNNVVNVGAALAPLETLPMAGILATPAQINAITKLPNIRSIYANRKLDLFLRETTAVIGATEVWQSTGLQGEGIGVAVLDTGIDATHKDLEFGTKTVQNVKLVGLQYAAGQDLDALNLPVKYVENVQNTDTSGGHGTHVAGIVGASGKASGGLYKGVAPKSNLIGLGAGDVLEIFTALAGFDWIIRHKAQYNIRVVNNSWGNIIPGFDPNNPVNVATKAVHDAGIAVVFAAGNSGSATDTLNTYSVAPWVIGVAAGGDMSGVSPEHKTRIAVAGFSSRGIPGDDFYRPTLTAPGYLVVSDRALTGAYTTGAQASTDPLLIPPEHLANYTAASGTSMAAPHVAGAIALMVQAKPSLTPDVIKRVLINSATPMPDFGEYAAGAGYLNVKAAVETAQSIKNVRKYRDPRTGKDVDVYDQTLAWNGNVGASAPGVVAGDTRTITIPDGTLALDVTVDWSVVANDLNLYVYDPQGNLAAKSETVQAVYNYASEAARVNAPAAGTWTINVSGFLSAPQAYKGTSNAVVRVNP